MRSSARN